MATVLESKHEASSTLSQQRTTAVWFMDAQYNINKVHVKTIANELQTILPSLQTFDQVETCVNYLKQVKHLPIILIVSETNGASILTRILGTSIKLRFIYVLCSDLYPTIQYG